MTEQERAVIDAACAYVAAMHAAATAGDDPAITISVWDRLGRDVVRAYEALRDAVNGTAPEEQP